MKELFIITGANGHLGNTILRFLEKRKCEVRGLVLPGERVKDHKNIRYYTGDITDTTTLEPVFSNLKYRTVYVIHTAGIVDISDEISPAMYKVNVEGTKNILKLCRSHSVKRLVYVSSVHAIPEKNKMEVLTETKEFSPEKVAGGYAKTKAEATRAVLQAAENGLDAVVVHPSGILGPYDHSGNHLVQMVHDYISGKLPACVKGGYDFVDVRDVAQGCIAAALRGHKGDCYILSNRHYEIKDVLSMVQAVNGGKKLPTLPLWIAKAAVPLIEWYAKKKHMRPLYTKYSLYTLNSNDRFSHDKATQVLAYNPRDLYQTIKDTVSWIQKEKLPAN